ncbi:MAG: ABC-type antimicrobial peptide transport system permease component [Bacteroidetes bacterium]|nr:ABC-type antimicrobial peptide transport system permease component [Bacteroidota bacterium]
MHAIRGSKLRSALTILGIVVGIFSVISVMTAMQVLRDSIEEGISDLGANTFQMQKFVGGFNTTAAERRRMRNRRNITYEQALQVREKITLAEAVGIEVWTGGKVVLWQGKKTMPNIGIAGENVEGLITNDMTVEIGRGLTSQDIDMARRVIILGKTVVDKLFPPSISPIGETVRIDGVMYDVIGVFAEKGSALGGHENNYAAIPITAHFARYGKSERSVHIMVKAKSREVFDDCVEQARFILRTARRVPPGEEDDFGYYSNDSLIKQFNEFTLYVRLGILLVSSISLIAAGVGIMNIMLVSVTERTREIGIRKAIGANRKDILSQFIIEAVILCQIGGILGIVAGIAGGNVLSILMEVSVVVPWMWVGIGFAACTVVGLIFGVYPAWKASTLDPIDALRYE